MLMEIDGRRYPVKAIGDLELRHMAQFQHEMATDPLLEHVTSLRTLAQVEDALAAHAKMGKAERQANPDGLFLTCFTVWASRVLAGENVTLVEAISVPLSKLNWIKEPADIAAAGEGQGKARKASRKGGRSTSVPAPDRHPSADPR